MLEEQEKQVNTINEILCAFKHAEQILRDMSHHEDCWNGDDIDSVVSLLSEFNDWWRDTEYLTRAAVKLNDEVEKKRPHTWSGRYWCEVEDCPACERRRSNKRNKGNCYDWEFREADK